ncbi:ankyrin repeat domain-containing protein [Chryseobacterium piperi]|nr:ankyrin repeat domain-containing protein [Chryseobacterium piperi]
MMTLLSCSDLNPRSRKKENKTQYPPAKMFKGDQLLAAQKILDGDLEGMEKVIKDKNIALDKLGEDTGYTLLMYASIIEDMNAMKKLLDLGANPNIVVPYNGYKTPLRHAVALNNYEMLKLLFSYKANPNPQLGDSPLYDAMMIGGVDDTERKMIDYLLKQGADINNLSYSGNNIMEAAARDDLDLTTYFLEKGGNPVIPGTGLCPMASYIEYKDKQKKDRNLPESPYYEKLSAIKKILIEKYQVQFPVKKDLTAEAALRIKLYEKLDSNDKLSVNFNNNYGENQYKKDLELIKKP